MKQKLLLILAAVFATATTAWAGTPTSGYCGKDGSETVSWSYDTETKILTISGSGDMENYYQSEAYSTVNGDNQPWKAYNEEIKEIIIEDGVTSIGYFAFYGCKNVESVTIANSVKWIFGHAFAECSSLTSVTMPGEFYFSEGDEDYYVNDLIDATFFENCNNLTTLTLTGTGTDAARYVVGSNNPLQSGSSELAGIKNLIIGDGITGIGDDAFNGCTGLTSVTIGSGVTTIGQYAFGSCENLTSIFIPDNVLTIKDYAFYECIGLTTVIIGSGVRYIGVDAFEYCTSVTDVFCYANPGDLTWNDESCDDFITDPNDPNYPTKCHVIKDYLDTFVDKWSKGVEDYDVNVEFVASTFKIDFIADDSETNETHTITLGNGAEELPYVMTFNGLLGGESSLDSKFSLNELTVTSGTNVTVGEFDGWDTPITFWGIGTSTLTMTVAQKSNLGQISGNIPQEITGVFSFNVVESILLKDDPDNEEAPGFSIVVYGDAWDLQGKLAVFNRTFTKGVVSTLCLPFPMTSIPGGTLYEFKDVNYDATANKGDGAWVADFTEEVAPTEENPTVIGIPYLFRADDDGAMLFSGTVPDDFDGFADTSEADHAGGGTWTFHGTFEKLTYFSAEAAPAEGPEPDPDDPEGGDDPSSEESGDEVLDEPGQPFPDLLPDDAYGFAGAADDYGVSAGDFVKAANGATVPAFRCYLTYSDGEGGTSLSRGDTNSLPSRIIVRLIGLDGQTTAIGTMDTRTGEVRLSDEWYSLDGRKLEGQPTKEGIYINKGKKLRIKN